MKKLILTTRNKGKLKEISFLLSDLHIEIVSVLDFPDIADVIEDGATLEENALKKAREIFNATRLPSLADDSGLEVVALGMNPGVYSARYAGEGVTYDDNNRKLLQELKNVPLAKRNARFHCVAAFVADGIQKTTEGICLGRIIETPRGAEGFGYDPLFVPDGYDKTFAELSLEVKNNISHRAKAFEEMKKFLMRLR